MLTNSVKVSDTTKTDFLELISFHSDWKNDKENALQI